MPKPLSAPQRQKAEALNARLQQLKRTYVSGEANSSSDARRKLLEEVKTVVDQITALAQQVIGADPELKRRFDGAVRQAAESSRNVPRMPRTKGRK